MQSFLTLKQAVRIITTVPYTVDNMKATNESVSINVILWGQVKFPYKVILNKLMAIILYYLCQCVRDKYCINE